MEEFEPEVNSHFLETGSTETTDESVKDSQLHPSMSAISAQNLNLNRRRDIKKKAMGYSVLHILNP